MPCACCSPSEVALQLPRWLAVSAPLGEQKSLQGLMLVGDDKHNFEAIVAERQAES